MQYVNNFCKMQTAVNLDMVDHCTTDFCIWHTICLVPIRCISSICHMYMTDFAYDGPIFLVPLSLSYPSTPVLCWFSGYNVPLIYHLTKMQVLDKILLEKPSCFRGAGMRGLSNLPRAMQTSQVAMKSVAAIELRIQFLFWWQEWAVLS